MRICDRFVPLDFKRRRAFFGYIALAIMVATALSGQTPSANSAQHLPQRKQPITASNGRALTLGTQPINEELLQRALSGNFYYLRGMYLDNELTFDQRGRLEGSSPRGSYTLALVEIRKVRLGKNKLELQGIRYGLHFLSQLPTEDVQANFDRVRITPNKKLVRISIERQRVVKPHKRTKEDHDVGAQLLERQETAHTVTDRFEVSSGDADGTTTSQQRADEQLRIALDRVFAPNIDARLIAAMPAFWREYFKAAGAGKIRAATPDAIYLQSNVDQKTRITVPIEAESNQFAQDGGIGGMALYHVVIDPNGRAGAITVARPIGFGLDENAVAAIDQTTFQPAIKDGKAVSVGVDAIVQFHIYSKRTNIMAHPAERTDQPTVKLPGPYGIEHP